MPLVIIWKVRLCCYSIYSFTAVHLSLWIGIQVVWLKFLFTGFYERFLKEILPKRRIFNQEPKEVAWRPREEKYFLDILKTSLKGLEIWNREIYIRTSCRTDLKMKCGRLFGKVNLCNKTCLFAGFYECPKYGWKHVNFNSSTGNSLSAMNFIMLYQTLTSYIALTKR